MTDDVRDYWFARTRTVRIMSDYCGPPLWALGGVESDSMGLSPDLVARLDAWQAVFDGHFHYERGWDDPDVAAGYAAEGRALLPLVSGQLPGYIVELDLWPTGGGTHRAGEWIRGWRPPPPDSVWTTTPI